VQSAGRLRGLRVTYRMLTALEELSGLEQHDAVLSCEVLQRVPRASRAALATVLRSLAPMGAVFVPNAENASHLAISGLAGLSMRELRGLFGAATFGYVDMPPFPPGIARSAEQRAKASTGRLEAIAMRVLNVYCSAERWLPAVVKRRFAHIVCAMWGA
jgi:hypothetical protein